MASLPHPFEHQLTQLLARTCPQVPVGQRQRLSWMLWAVVLTGSCVLRQVANTVASCLPAAGHASSHERRLRRIIADPGVSWHALYAPLLTSLLRQVTGAVTVIVDESGHTDVVRALTAALWYQGRAIPLAWIVWKGQTPHPQPYWAACADLLDRVALLLPAHVTITVVADRAFGCPAFLDLVTARGWTWVVRVQGQTQFQPANGGAAALKTKVGGAGAYWTGHGQVFKKQGWRTATAVAYWRTGCAEPLLLVSSLALPMLSVRRYRWRAAIEALFRDWKSYGWQWEASQVTQVAHQERVLLIIALATVVTLLLGVEAAAAVVAGGPQQGRRRPWAARDSLFQLGRQRCLQRIWTHSADAVGDHFPPPGTRTWAQICWASAAPAARMSTVVDGAVRHRK